MVQWTVRCEKWQSKTGDALPGQPKLTPRQFRYRWLTLHGEGFLDFEKRYLVAHTIKGPGISGLRAERRREYRKALAGLTGKEVLRAFNAYEHKIANRYVLNNWRFKLDGRLNPFACLNAFRRSENLPPYPSKPKISKEKRAYATTRENTIKKPITRRPKGHEEFLKRQELQRQEALAYVHRTIRR